MSQSHRQICRIPSFDHRHYWGKHRPRSEARYSASFWPGHVERTANNQFCPMQLSDHINLSWFLSIQCTLISSETEISMLILLQGYRGRQNSHHLSLCCKYFLPYISICKFVIKPKQCLFWAFRSNRVRVYDMFWRLEILFANGRSRKAWRTHSNAISAGLSIKQAKRRK